MRPHSAAALRLSLLRLGLIGAAFAVTVLTMLVRSGETSPTKIPAAALRPARNPERLHLLLDPAKVLGWISGVRDHAGATIAVTVVDKKKTIKIDKGNTFAWPYRVEKASRAEFAWGKLKQTIILQPPSKVPPCVFFVVDR
ncbi:MAG TPA: hypothetical protein VH682_13305, partial [Gemmataceae bacterium]